MRGNVIRSTLYLENKFNCEDTGENKIEVIEDFVAIGFGADGVLGGQGDAARADDDHDEQVKITKINDKMAELPNAATCNIRR